ncbi:MAG: arsenate reductase ArsC, partial [Alphaproteobacteria bacterium]
MSKLPSSILFVCSENALRSPMAEALTKARYGDRVYVDSVGVRDGDLDPLAIAVLDEIGVDMSRHKSKCLDDLMDTSFEVIVTLSPEAQHKAIEITRVSASEVEYWPTPDPSVAEGHRDARVTAYRELRDYLVGR